MTEQQNNQRVGKEYYEKYLKPPETPPSSNGQPPSGQEDKSDEILKMTFGKYGVSLPQDKEERNEVGEILINMINLAIGKKPTDPKK